jgi:protein-S-isoprenylcysteine O-methyltransferase Ste14
MYVAWTLGYVALALRSRSPWPWLLLPGLVAWMHAEVLREERQLEATFGDEWVRFSARSPRYAGRSG